MSFYDHDSLQEQIDCNRGNYHEISLRGNYFNSIEDIEKGKE